MKFKTKEEMQDDVDSLGMCALSKFSSINHLSKLGIPLPGMLMIESMVREIECGLWSLVPLGLGGKTDVFQNQVDHLTKKFNSIIEAAKAMKIVKDNL
jgi:hypothetical protein